MDRGHLEHSRDHRTAGGGVWLGAGPRAVEDRLVREVEGCLGAARTLREDPWRLAVPVRIVVPSRSLREHVGSLLVRRRGRALAGVRVQSLDALALEVTERAGRRRLPTAWLAIRLRQLARQEPALAAALDDLVDGYGAVAAAVDDLLDAGLEPIHAGVILERLGEVDRAPAVVARAQALVRVARQLAEELEAGRLGHRSRTLVLARREIERDPELALPARALFVHGFSDATGVQSDLLAALVTLRAARVLLDAPRDPALPGGPSPAGAAFGARFRERIEGAAGVAPEIEAATEAAPAPLLELAPRPEAEAEAAAVRVQRLVESGVAPERIGLVARELAPYRLALRRHLLRRGVPFSGLAEPGCADAAGRRLASLLELLARGPASTLERWLEALSRLRLPSADLRLRSAGWAGRRAPSGAERADLRHAVHTLGLARLRDLAALDTSHEVTLAARRGLAVGAGDAAPHARRRRLPAASLEALAAAARAACARWEAWPTAAPLAKHLAALRDLVERDLGWTRTTPGRDAVDELLRETPAPEDLRLDREDFVLYARRCLEGRGAVPIGGRGGGVQLLSVMEARARSFEHLVLVGVNRGVFPRVVSEDPLLPDAVRRALRDVLPELPVKREGVDEERFLFAQLLASSGSVVLSWSATDADGRASPPSPLVERLRRGAAPRERAAGAAIPSIDTGSRREPADAASPLPLHDHLVRSGLLGSRDAFEGVLRLALAVTPAALDAGGAPTDLARARLAVLRELDPRGARRGTLGPYFGFVGAMREAADPRRRAPYVTTVEHLARCPWLAFVDRLLHVGPVPDAHGALPTASNKRLVGNLVHDVLESIAAGDVEGDRRESLDEIRSREPRAVAWPAPAQLEALLCDRAEACVRDEGIALPGYARVLARLALPYLDVARRVDWPGPGATVPVVGVEVEGAMRSGGREIRFRADRVDRLGAVLRLTDYKTGRPIGEQQDASRRQQAHLEAVARGRQLQASAYAVAGGEGAVGRFLFLGDHAEHAREFPVRAEDGFGPLLEASSHTLLDAWERGGFVPRLRAPDHDEEPRACTDCDVKHACLRGDSGARRRLSAWVESAEAQDLRGVERALLRVWRLPEATP